MNMDVFKSVIEVNLYGSIYCSAHAAFFMSKNKEPEDSSNGVIINLSSVSGTEAQFSQVPYGASKGAVDSFTFAMARDLGKFRI